MSQELPSPDVMIDLIKVSKVYPPDVQALTDISLAIARGEMVFLTGRSGAGAHRCCAELCPSTNPYPCPLPRRDSGS